MLSIFGKRSGIEDASKKASKRPQLSKQLRVEALESRQLMATDLVLDWNSQALAAIRAESTPPPAASRNLAILHIAIYDTVNSLTRERQTYAAEVMADPQASMQAAISAAASTVLDSLYPSRASTIDAFHTQTLAAIPDGMQETAGVTLGKAVAEKILALRSNDGSSDTVAYTPKTGPGNWQPTPPANAAPLLPQWPGVTPFAMNSVEEFAPNDIPALTSAEYTQAFNEVRDLGSATSTTRTADQTNIAKFWANGGGTATPPGHMNILASNVSQATNLSLAENARLFAMMNVAMADAAIMAWQAKYATDFWRPVTAIRAADTDGNNATTQDAAWTPFLTTPPFQSYISGHASFSGAGAGVLKAFFGTDNISFTLKSEDATVPDRSFTSFSQAAQESADSRIYGGIHWRFDNEDGLTAGNAIANLVSTKLFAAKDLGGVADIVGTTLSIIGTSGSDTISLTAKKNRIYVTLNGLFLGSIATSSVTYLSIQGGQGNDTITVSSQIALPSTLQGGAGNDLITSGSGNDVINGDDGDDTLNGGAGIDFVFGSGGNDDLIGALGIDTLDGGLGQNRIRRR